MTSASKLPMFASFNVGAPSRTVFEPSYVCGLDYETRLFEVCVPRSDSGGLLLNQREATYTFVIFRSLKWQSSAVIRNIEDPAPQCQIRNPTERVYGREVFQVSRLAEATCP